MFGALLIAFVGIRFKALCLPVTLGALTVSLAATIETFRTVLSEGEFIYLISGWERLGEGKGISIGIEYRVDAISALVLLVIAAVSLLVAVYSRTRVVAETPDRIPYYYMLYLLLVAGLAGMTITNDAFNLFVLLEISSLTSYALIAVGSRRAVLSAFNYVIMGTIGASFYLLGVGYLYIKTGVLNMEDIHAVIVANDLAESPSIQVAFVLILMAVWIKMAFFPLHAWLPNAYSYSPTTTGALMAPLVTKVMIYIMIRMMVTVFGLDYAFRATLGMPFNWSNLVVSLSSIAIVAGSVMALSRRDLKKMLSYIIIAEVGYMVGGAWLANERGMTGAVYHIVNDAFMTLCLFLAVGVFIARTGDPRIAGMNGLFKKMPITMAAFTIGALSMIGLPPTCGFFSKWYLVGGGIEAGQWHFVGALLFSSLVNAVIFFRIFEIAYFPKELSDPAPECTDPDAAPVATLQRTPLSMSLPLWISAIALIGLGIFNHTITQWIGSALGSLKFFPPAG
ncbi:MAG: proton-conducting transporter membrane subunit [Verrucomicrobia bacterium]|nr:proton-conducting transporter membrane subunit [Verrucomicrobiota bacterium]